LPPGSSTIRLVSILIEPHQLLRAFERLRQWRATGSEAVERVIDAMRFNCSVFFAMEWVHVMQRARLTRARPRLTRARQYLLPFAAAAVATLPGGCVYSGGYPPPGYYSYNYPANYYGAYPGSYTYSGAYTPAYTPNYNGVFNTYSTAGNCK
jgi:hypothetical protein